MNFNQCSNCSKKGTIQIKEKTEHEDDDGVESVKYQRMYLLYKLHMIPTFNSFCFVSDCVNLKKPVISVW